MHLGNGIICPATGIPMLVITGAAAFYAYKTAKNNFSKDKAILITALTAFIFAMQMINFSIPATGSSGHIIGGILLAALMGPYVAFLAICAILIIQSVFFADGGLLALGCNIFNMGVLACFVVYPFLYKPLAERNKYLLGAFLSSIAALQFGAFAVVIESALSGSIQLSNILSFAALMQFIHLPIGMAEGIITSVVVYLSKHFDVKKLSISFGCLSLILSGFIAQYVSKKPDGLEWSLLNLSDSIIIQTQGYIYNFAEIIQSKTAILANISSFAANITGIALITILMYSISLILNRKSETVKVSKIDE